MPLSVEDKFAIREVISLYGHIIDNRQFSRLGEIFCDDAVFDLSGYGGNRYAGLDAIHKMMCNSTEHPLAHHATNIVIDDSGETVKVMSKGLGVGKNGRVGSVVYVDDFRRNQTGWRIKHRSCSLRRTEDIPPIS